MFYQTQTARKPLKVPATVNSRHPVTPGGHGMVLLHVISTVRRTPYNALSVAMMRQFSRFCTW